MNSPFSVILYRSLPGLIDCVDEEVPFCQKHFKTYFGCGAICKNEKNKIVIGRYSVLPHYKEVYNDLFLTSNLSLINSPSQHENIADITKWCYILDGYTPKTYTEWGNLTYSHS